MKQELLNVLVWLSAFLFFELPAKDVLGIWPWDSLSRTVWMGESWWKPVTLITAATMFVLLGHFEWQWRVRWLVLTSTVGALLILSHAFRKYFNWF